jgi:hypothetical protein
MQMVSKLNQKDAEGNKMKPTKKPRIINKPAQMADHPKPPACKAGDV